MQLSFKICFDFKCSRNKIKNNKYVWEYINQFKKECMFCGSKDYLEIHHKDKNNENNRIDNLVFVCHSCHEKVHGRKIPNLKKIYAKKIINKKRSE